MPEIDGVEYGTVAFEFMREIAEQRTPDGKLPGTLANEAAVLHEFHRQFPGVKMVPDDGWIPVPPEIIAELHARADERHTQKRSFASSRYWHEDSHFVGLIGEWLVSKLTGRPYDITLRISGDVGADFPHTDVKTSTFISDPHLKHLVNAKKWVPYYVLCVFDPNQSVVRLAGWATEQMLRVGPVRDYGHGANHHLDEAALLDGLPPSLT